MADERRVLSRWRGARLVLALVVALAALVYEATRQRADDAARPMAGSRANVLWILLDACRADHVSAYGYGRKTTPHIDGLAERGTTFLANFSQAPNTLLSVPSYLTGRFEPVSYQDPRHLGIWFLREPPEEEMLIPTILAENGYETAMFSASPWFSAESRLGRSFDTFGTLAHGPDVPDVSFERRNPELFGWIEHRSARPFFLYVHSMDTHSPRYGHNTLETWIDHSFPSQRNLELRTWIGAPFDDEDRAHVRDIYDGGLAYADTTVGELLAALERSGLLDETIVIVSSDHGEILGEDGHTLGHPADQVVDQLLHVPLVIAGPGFPEGRRVGHRTQNADIVPTLVEALAIETAARFDGRSLLPVSKDPSSGGVHEFIFSKVTRFLPVSEPDRVVVLGQTKYVFAAEDTGPPRVWSMPDLLGARRAARPPEGQRRRARAFLQEHLVPLWERKASRPQEIPPYADFNHSIGTRGAVVDRLDPADGRWTRHDPTQDAFGGAEFLVGFPWQETVPGLSLQREVPPGVYEVYLELGVPAVFGRARGASVAFRAAGEASFRTFSLEPGEATRWVPLGTYRIDGVFEYEIGPGRRDALASAGRLRLMRAGPGGAEPLSPAQSEEEMERLRALGYADP